MGEVGFPEFDLGVWMMFMGPPHMNPSIANQRFKQIETIMAEPALVAKIQEQGVAP